MAEILRGDHHIRVPVDMALGKVLNPTSFAYLVDANVNEHGDEENGRVNASGEVRAVVHRGLKGVGAHGDLKGAAGLTAPRPPRVPRAAVAVVHRTSVVREVEQGWSL